jgi:hypothetical protein
MKFQPVLVTSLTLIGLVAFAPSPVAAAPTGGSTSDYLASADPVVLANQEVLMGFKSWLIEVPGIFGAGFVESANYAESKSTTLLWTGTSTLQGAVIAEGARRGITVTIKPVKYSRRQLQDGVDKLWASASSPAWDGFVITSVTATDLNQDGLAVQGHYRSAPDESSLAARLAATQQVATGVSALVTGVSIAPEPTLYVTRSTDFAPFNAGGMMRGANGTGCSSGFAIWLGGVARTTTARHCTSTPYRAWDASANSYGTTVTTTPGSGARVLTAGGFYWMFDGAWNDPNGYHKTVVGFADLSVNDWVCTSGANSGVHCGIQVDHLLISFNDGFGAFWTIRGKQRTSGQIAGAQGDSGGPVLVPYSNNNWTTVGAAGMIQGSLGPQTTSCGSVRIGGVFCSTEIEFSSTHTIVNELGGSLRTG